jgi:hypothetical protein
MRTDVSDDLFMTYVSVEHKDSLDFPQVGQPWCGLRRECARTRSPKIKALIGRSDQLGRQRVAYRYDSTASDPSNHHPTGWISKPVLSPRAQQSAVRCKPTVCPLDRPDNTC